METEGIWKHIRSSLLIVVEQIVTLLWTKIGTVGQTKASRFLKLEEVSNPKLDSTIV
jgi:hypothetical protein